jgi:hypothetical protein
MRSENFLRSLTLMAILAVAMRCCRPYGGETGELRANPKTPTVRTEEPAHGSAGNRSRRDQLAQA